MIKADTAKQISQMSINSIDITSHLEYISGEIQCSAQKGHFTVKIELLDLDLILPDDEGILVKIKDRLIESEYEVRVYMSVPYDFLIVSWKDT